MKKKFKKYNEVECPLQKHNPILSCEEKNLCLCAGCGKIVDCSVSLCNYCEVKINKDEPSWYRK